MLLLTQTAPPTTTALDAITETQAVVQEVSQDLQQLKPNVIAETFKNSLPGLLSFGYRILAAIIIVLIGMKVISIIKKLLKKTFTKMNMDTSLSKFLVSLANAIMYFIVIFMALEKIGVPSASIIAVLGSASIAVGLSLQGSLSNFAGGILILIMHPFRVGDYIVCGGNEGSVKVIGLVYTTLLTVDNREVTMPNGALSSSTVINVTAQGTRMLEVQVGIGYTSDLKKAKAIMKELLESNEKVMKDKPVTVFVSELADSAVVLGVRGWVESGDYFAVKWDTTENIKLRFDEAGIEIPFNQIDVNVKKNE